MPGLFGLGLGLGLDFVARYVILQRLCIFSAEDNRPLYNGSLVQK